MTLWFNVIFDADHRPPYLPVNLHDGDKVRLRVQSMIKLSADGNRKPELKSRWRGILRDEILDVPGLGIHSRKGRWLVFARDLSAPPDRLIHELTETGTPLLRCFALWRVGKSPAAPYQHSKASIGNTSTGYPCVYPATEVSCEACGMTPLWPPLDWQPLRSLGTLSGTPSKQRVVAPRITPLRAQGLAWKATRT